MELFSEREGYKKAKIELQLNSIDNDLINCLWNLICINLLNNEYIGRYDFMIKIWMDYFKKPIDEIPYHPRDQHKFIKNYFFNCEWHEIYSFIEFISNIRVNNFYNSDFIKSCNKKLEEELSGYRFVNGLITKITSEEEISAIEEAINVPKPFENVSEHIKQALSLFSDRKNPDYRNSIKESISAVEAICKLLTKNDKATLGQALDILERDGKIKIHSSLKISFDKLYGYTSNADGIRHALLGESNLDFEDAKFMLVACSSFVNYLIAKASKSNISLE